MEKRGEKKELNRTKVESCSTEMRDRGGMQRRIAVKVDESVYKEFVTSRSPRFIVRESDISDIE